MTTTSFPVVGDNLDHAQWRALESGTDGLVDTDASAADRERLNLDLSDLGTTAKVKRGKVQLKGFVMTVTAAHDLTLAASGGSPVTYAVGVMYDPALEANSAGPLYLNAQVKASQVIPSGGAYLPLYEVTRTSGQVLSQAAVTDLRVYVGPSLLVPANYPLTGTGYPLGTHMYRGSHHLVRVPNAAGTAWEWQDTNAPNWKVLNLPSSVQGFGGNSNIEYGRMSGFTVMRGAWQLVSGADFQLGGGTGGWYSLGSLPTGYRPSETMTRQVDQSFTAANNNARVQILTDGTVRGQVGPGPSSFIRADDVIFPAEI